MMFLTVNYEEEEAIGMVGVWLWESCFFKFLIRAVSTELGTLPFHIIITPFGL